MLAKSREITVRRTLERRGLRLERCRRRDPHAIGHGRYRITDAEGHPVTGDAYTLSLDDAEAWARNPAPGGPPSATVRRPAAEPRPGSVTLHVGDALTVLKTLPSNHYAACISSPPYFQVRATGDPGEIGMEDTPEEHVRRLVRVFREVRRTLRPDGTCWIVVDDSRSTRRIVRGDGKRSVTRNMAGRAPLPRWRDAAAEGRTRTGVPGYPEKSLLLVPQRLGIALQRDGWIVRSVIVWNKTHSSPDPARDRPAHAYETVLMLAKEPRYYHRGEHLMEEALDGSLRQGRDVWTIAPSAYRSDHTSAMPLELATRCLLAGSRPRQEIIDPFAGTGTVGLAAAQNRRRATLIELWEAHAQTIRERLGSILR